MAKAKVPKVRRSASKALKRAGKGLKVARKVGKVAKGPAAAIWAAQEVEGAANALDQSIILNMSGKDIERAAKAEGEAREATARVRTEITETFSPEQRAAFGKKISEILAGMTHKDSRDGVFRQRQLAFISKMVLDQMKGELTPEEAQGQQIALSRLNDPKAEETLGSRSLGKSDVEQYRTSVFGRRMGMLRGKFSEAEMGELETALRRRWETIVHPIRTLKRGLWDGESFYTPTGQAETNEVPPGIRERVEGMLGLEKSGLQNLPDDTRTPPGGGDDTGKTLKKTKFSVEEVVNQSLKASGFGPEVDAAAAAYNPTPDWASLIGGRQQAKYNPARGGRAAGIDDVQRRLMGTQESQEAAYQQDRAFNENQLVRRDAARREGLQAAVGMEQARAGAGGGGQQQPMSLDKVLTLRSGMWADRAAALERQAAAIAEVDPADKRLTGLQADINAIYDIRSQELSGQVPGQGSQGGV